MFNQQLLLFLCNNNYSIFLLDSYSGEIQHYNNFYDKIIFLWFFFQKLLVPSLDLGQI